MTYRLAETSDAKLYFDWVNDPEVRKNAHNTDPILWENHVKWFNKMVNSEALMLLFFDGETPVGQLRVDNDGNEGVVDISVDPAHRNKGIGTEMLKVLKKFILKMKFMSDRDTKVYLVAEVKQTNIPSLRAFEKAGFEFLKVVNVKGVDCNVFIL